jgi:hypothetical protein
MRVYSELRKREEEGEGRGPDRPLNIHEGLEESEQFHEFPSKRGSSDFGPNSSMGFHQRGVAPRAVRIVPWASIKEG